MKVFVVLLGKVCICVDADLATLFLFVCSCVCVPWTVGLLVDGSMSCNYMCAK